MAPGILKVVGTWVGLLFFVFLIFNIMSEHQLLFGTFPPKVIKTGQKQSFMPGLFLFHLFPLGFDLPAFECQGCFRTAVFKESALFSFGSTHRLQPEDSGAVGLSYPRKANRML